MEGIVLGFDNKANDGAIKGENGNRYPFTGDSWKSDVSPSINMLVDFEILNKMAINIFPIKDKDAERNKTILGIVSLLLTFFLGVIGTIISRLAISKHSFSKSALAISIHFIITLLALIPIIGWVFYVIGTICFMIKNYQYVQNP